MKKTRASGEFNNDRTYDRCMLLARFYVPIKSFHAKETGKVQNRSARRERTTKQALLATDSGVRL